MLIVYYYYSIDPWDDVTRFDQALKHMYSCPSHKANKRPLRVTACFILECALALAGWLAYLKRWGLSQRLTLISPIFTCRCAQDSSAPLIRVPCLF